MDIMKVMSRQNALLFLLSTIIVSGCFSDPQFPEQPVIRNLQTEFIRVGGLGDADTLSITVDFEDGDGDLGLGVTETDPKYNPILFFDSLTAEKSFVLTNRAIRYGFRDSVSQIVVRTTLIDSLPDFNVFPNNCLYYEQLGDIIYYKQNNPSNFNILVRFFVETDTGDFEEFLWDETSFNNECPETVNGRFPILKENIDQKSPLDGSLTYNIISRSLIPNFEGKTIKVRVKIKDRELNTSNELESTPILIE